MADLPAIDVLEKFLDELDGAGKKEFDRLFAQELSALWLPDARNEPQTTAYHSKADLMLYGGAAGGGKTDMLLGVAVTQHKRSVIFRKQATDLRDVSERLLAIVGGRDGWNGVEKVLRRDDQIIEFGHLEKPGSEEGWRGRPHDFIGFDEGAQLQKTKVQFVLGWLRSTSPGQRCRAIIASNPPSTDEGAWLLEWFAPWLDPGFPNKAANGELRWAVSAPNKEGTTVWLADNSPVIFEDPETHRRATDEEIALDDPRIVTPLSRTFIPSLLANNPYLAKTGYRAQLQSMPEPLRTQLLTGDFLSGRQDHERQVIPTAWIDAAMSRWTANPPRCPMTAMGVDVAAGGDDQTVIAVRYGGWFGNLVKKAGSECREPTPVAAAILNCRRDQCPVIIDLGGGFGGDALGLLERQGIPCTGYLGNRPSNATTKEGHLKFYNRRAEDWWRLREELDPNQEFGSAIALPPDPQLKADLSSPRIKDMSSTRGILIEEKADIKKRLGRSTDAGDAVVMALNEGSKAKARQQADSGRQARQERANTGFSSFKDKMRAAN